MQSHQSPGTKNAYSFLPWNNRKEDNSSGKTEAVLNGLKQLNLQSAQERERVLEEVHGVADSQVEETPELIDQRLNLLEQEIQLIKKRTAYDRALFLSPKYVLDREFRLMFLRSELFDARKAANRLVRFFESKKELWGDDKIARPITLDDFDEDGLALLKHGAIQVLPEKDQSGRSVFFLASKHYRCMAWLEIFRVVWYQLLTALEDEETQLKGFVLIIYQVGTKGVANGSVTELLMKAPIVKGVMPVRFVAVHFCLDDSVMHTVLNLLQVVLGKQYQHRFRSHYGSDMESQYALASFGIPRSILPVNENGELEGTDMDKYLDRRREKESLVHYASSIIECPREDDVLLGRGRPYQIYPGNFFLKKVIEKEIEAYQRADRFEKTCISEEIVRMIQAKNGRFLKRDDSGMGWIDVDDKSAREKVSHGFRTKKSRAGVLEENVSLSDESHSASLDHQGKRKKCTH